MAAKDELTMICYLEGDFLLSEAQVLDHGVAPGDHVESGRALALRERWPAMVKDDRRLCHGRHPKAGKIRFWGGADVKPLVVRHPGDLDVPVFVYGVCRRNIAALGRRGAS